MIPDAHQPAEHLTSRCTRLRKIHPELESPSDAQLLQVIGAETQAELSAPRVIFGIVLAILASVLSVPVFADFARQVSALAPQHATVIRACLWSLGAFTFAMPWMPFVRLITLSRPWRAIPELDGMPDAECEAIMNTAQADVAFKLIGLTLNVAAAAGVLISLGIFLGVVGRLYYEHAEHRPAILVGAAWIGTVLCSLPVVVTLRIRDLALRRKIRSSLRSGVTPKMQPFASPPRPARLEANRE